MDSNRATVGTFWLTFAILVLTAGMFAIMVWTVLHPQQADSQSSLADSPGGGFPVNIPKPLLLVGSILAVAIAMQVYLAFRLLKNKKMHEEIDRLNKLLSDQSLGDKDKETSSKVFGDKPLRFVMDRHETVRVTVNRCHFWSSLAFMDSGAYEKSWQIKDFPVRVYTKPNGLEPYIDTKVYSQEVGLVEIRGSRLLVMPTGWDQNQNDRAIEIVNEYGIPVFQAVLSAANQLDISAVFSERESKSGWRMETLFKYPSKEHPGEFARDFGWFPLEAKSLYQLFLGGCGQTGVSHSGYRMVNPEAKEFRIEYTICHNTDSKALYFNIFMPKGGDPAHFLKLFAAEYQDFLKPHLSGSAFIRMNPGEPPERATDLVFTGVIGIYHEEPLLPEEPEAIREEFAKHGASARLYGPDYVIIRNSPLVDRASGQLDSY
jgi:hypothetical protein